MDRPLFLYPNQTSKRIFKNLKETPRGFISKP
nr:MAG TPA: hypothetical protein [Caudoviricetes sp.]